VSIASAAECAVSRAPGALRDDATDAPREPVKPIALIAGCATRASPIALPMPITSVDLTRDDGSRQIPKMLTFNAHGAFALTRGDGSSATIVHGQIARKGLRIRPLFRR
jgi:hypothetical protein